MRDQERIARICNLLYRVWKKEFNNDLRFTQLLLNAIDNPQSISETPEGRIAELFYMEDDILEQKLREFYKDKI